MILILEKIKSKKKLKMVFRFLISGTLAALLTLGLLYLFVDIFGWWYLVSATIAFSLAILGNFCLQKFWAFEDRNLQGASRQFSLFLAISLFNLLLNTVFMYVFVDKLGLYYLLAQFLSAGIIAGWSFIAYFYLVFNQKTKKSALNSQETAV